MSDIQSIAKAVSVLGSFDRMNRVLTIRKIVERTGIPKSTVHEICRTLVKAQYLESQEGGGFKLGIGLAMLGGQVIERQGIVDASQLPMQRYLDRFRLESHVALYIPGAIFYAYIKRPISQANTLNRTGRKWAIHTSACGRVILAAMSEAARDKELTNVITSEEREQIDREILGYEQHGFLVSEVSQRGLRSVAAPIFDTTGLPIGAIGTAELVQAMNRHRVTELGRAVKKAAWETSRSLGMVHPELDRGIGHQN